MRKAQNIVGVGLFTIAYLLIATIFAVQTFNREFILYIGVMVVLALGVIALHRTVTLSQRVLWGLSIWGILHMVGGLVRVPAGWPTAGSKPVFYSWWLIPDVLKYDHVVHAFGFAIATVACWECVRPALKKPKPSWGILLLCVIGGMGLGAFNEIVEFSATLLIPDTNVGGYANTGWDLVANAVGAVCAALYIGIRESSTRA